MSRYRLQGSGLRGARRAHHRAVLSARTPSILLTRASKAFLLSDTLDTPSEISPVLAAKLRLMKSRFGPALARFPLNRLLESDCDASLFISAFIGGDSRAFARLEKRFAECQCEHRFCVYVRKCIYYRALRLRNERIKRARREIPYDAGPRSAPSDKRRVPELDWFSRVPAESDTVTDAIDVHIAMRELTDRQRLVMQYAVIDDRSQDDIAAELGVTQQAVSRTIARALARLRCSFYDGRATRAG